MRAFLQTAFAEPAQEPEEVIYHDRRVDEADDPVAGLDPPHSLGVARAGHHDEVRRGVEGTHVVQEMEAIGVPGVEIPQPVNLFTSFPLSPDGTIGIAAPETRPGDYVIMRAEMDSYVCVSACPQDQNQTNSGVPTEIRVEVGG